MPAVNHKLLRDRRDELDLSNGDLAALTQIDYTYLRNIVCGTNRPSMRLIYRLSRALDLPVDDIVAEQPQPTGDPSDPPKQPKREPTGPARRQETEQKKTGPKRASDKAVA